MSNKEKEYYQKLDLIRIISCISVLLYHLNILKGGFLAVCTFFTLSGYLSCINALRNEKFSIKKYYISRLKKIYLPLLIVVFLTLAILSQIKTINWLNLKPETTSVLLGYNNFWQIDANLDYFKKQLDSPFMHMWYISILLQIELIFPIIIILLKKIGEKTKKYIPIIITIILSILSYIYFYNSMVNNNIMKSYYSTFARLFSYLLGISFAYISYYHKPIISKLLTKLKLNKLYFYIYILILLALFTIINVKTTYLEVYMLLTSLITIRLIDYGTIENNKKNKLLSLLSSISYEIYLVQYPIIFIFQNLKITSYLRIPGIIIITLIASYIIHISLNIKESKIKIPRIILCTLISLVSIFGIYQYTIAEDHTKEMQKLEEKINKNKLLTEQKQKEYQERIKKEQENWQLELNNFSNKEEELKEKITNLPVVGIGDSVMLGAANALYEVFPNGYFDGKVNRTELEARDIINDLKSKGLLTDILIFNLGTNGECASNCKRKVMDAVGNRQVFWVNATNPDYDTCNPDIEKAAQEYPNIHIVDWVSIVDKHPEYVASDRTHVGGTGAKVYSQTIYDEIYKYYLQELNKQKEEIIKEHQEQEKNKITFFGNDLLLNVYEYIQDDYKESEFIIETNLTYKTIIEEITKRKEENKLTNNIAFIYDKNLKLTKEELHKIIDLCNNANISIITTEKINIPNKDNLNLINLSTNLKENDNYLSPDKIHLTEKGNLLLKKIIKEKYNY